MLKVNDYFDGNVKSISLETAEGPATVGVMAPGEYEFGTSSFEIMKVISGKLTVLLPGSSGGNSSCIRTCLSSLRPKTVS